MAQAARALWIVAPEQVDLRPVAVEPGPGDVVIETLYTGISRGTERLVFQGRVPESEHATMRAPLQEGAFPAPVKYGYCAVGRVSTGDRAGQVVFVLHPHQTRFACPAQMAVPVPNGVPPARAVLAANMETALNILWDAQVAPGDRVAVIGAGTVGALVGYLAARVPGTDVTLIDRDGARAALAEAFGCRFAQPEAAQGDADVVIHASASAAGLGTAIGIAGVEARVVEASWYGSGETPVALGGAFHQRRLQIISSQVGRIPASHAARWDYRRRMEVALRLLVDPVLDRLISGETRFDDLPRDYAGILAAAGTLCHRVRYGA
ncbi:Threonine dehydrogenase [Roseovarius mucosus DSM 17069]|uniref:Threonine dehydrogenase n=1 Tax=Roseovarius mucosus DSM 17069 TaxID=1288298 RepID=A0A0A0HNT0_9RHOB|nr:zinc-binding alcohol dehydrogenase [Roseovarius mucosus]KGM88596.1 Threonine dehydrogenase [Roseovarius mucosus DSM 17069]